ncbi:NAD-dependent epimerase/dehydratase family protein [Patescibacteria group bacterium]
MNKNLVIGSAGFIGTPFCKFLEEKGESVTAFDIKDNKAQDGRSFKFDFKKYDKIYFLAWDVGGSKYLYKEDLQKAQLEWNLELMTNIFHQLDKSKKDFMFATSQLSEETDTVYGVTKRLGEVWTGLLKGVAIRIWNAYGELEEKNVKSHVISDFIHQALETGKIEMMTDGAEWRQFTHIKDLSNAFYMAHNLKNRRKTIYDASSYEWVRIIDVANIIGKLIGAKVIPGDKTGHNPVPSQNMGRVPGWLPKISLEDGISKMIKQAKNNINVKKT